MKSPALGHLGATIFAVAGAAEEWRTTLGVRLVQVTVPVMLLGLLALWELVGPDWGRIVMVSTGGVMLVALTSEALRPRLRPVHRSWLVVIALLLSALSGFVAVGPIAGPGAGTAMTVLLAGLLLGRRAMYGTLLFSTVAVGLIGLGMSSGHLPTPAHADVDFHSAAVWARTTIMWVLFVVITSVGVLYVVERLERAREQAAADATARELAEHERKEAEHLAAQSQKLETLGRLAAGVAHDFNNALTVIRLWQRVLASSPTSEQLRDASDAIGDAADQAAGLATQLLALARREAPIPTRIHLDTLVDRYKRSLGRAVSGDVSIEVDTRGDAVVIADEVQLHQILLNLVMNARDAMGGSGSLSIRTRAVAVAETRGVDTGELTPGRWASLEVEDTGSGMDEPTRRRAFEPFFTTKPAGTGLGLSTVAAIVRDSDGQMELWSEPGRGTRFTIWLRVAAGKTGNDAPAEPETRSEI